MKSSQNGGNGAVMLARALPLSFELEVAANPVVNQDLALSSEEAFIAVSSGH